MASDAGSDVSSMLSDDPNRPPLPYKDPGPPQFYILFGAHTADGNRRDLQWLFLCRQARITPWDAWCAKSTVDDFHSHLMKYDNNDRAIKYVQDCLEKHKSSDHAVRSPFWAKCLSFADPWDDPDAPEIELADPSLVDWKEDPRIKAAAEKCREAFEPVRVEPRPPFDKDWVTRPYPEPPEGVVGATR
jgi:hypothetical protein